MEQFGPTADPHDISGSMDVNELVQMLAAQARENMVAIMDVAMPAPSLTGIKLSAFHIGFFCSKLRFCVIIHHHGIQEHKPIRLC